MKEEEEKRNTQRTGTGSVKRKEKREERSEKEEGKRNSVFVIGYS